MAARLKEPGFANHLRVKHDAFGNYIDFNGFRIYRVTTALADNVTAVPANTAPDGSLATTSHATGTGTLFVVVAGVVQAVGF